MVLLKNLNYSFNGYQVPVIPKASRTTRGRGTVRKKSEDNQIQAFEILASVAGNFLQENKNLNTENAVAGKHSIGFVGINIKDKQEEEAGSFKSDDGCCSENASGSVSSLEGKHNGQRHVLNGYLFNNENFSSKDQLHGIALENFSLSSILFCSTESLSRVEGFSSFLGNRLEGHGQNVFEKEADGLIKENCVNEKTVHVTGSSAGVSKPDHRASKRESSENSFEKPSLECLIHGSSGRKLFNRDDDENFAMRTQPTSKNKNSGPLLDMPLQSVNSVSASKSRDVGQKSKNGSLYGSDDSIGRDNYMLESSQRMYPFKKRKFFKQTSFSASDRGSHCRGRFDSSDTGVDDVNCSAAIGASSSIAGQQVHTGSRDCNVKLSIKSFKVPELFIDIPETATIGSLKRTVMEAVTAILGDELHVGILLQGKKVQDDNKTLIQTGISQDDKHHRLGFMLEPRHTKITPPSYCEDPPFRTTSSHRDISRKPTSLMLQQRTYNVSQEHSLIKFESCGEGDLNVVPTLADTSPNNTMSKCRALVAVPAIDMEALAVIPFRHKPRNPDFVQRRIRRPFSVSEVEALVQAVEKLGTGRWRDVKQCAFDNAKHRTYVDLKDKWKTLVHTARISPQQRRGEPVPQELLDRVLAAHAYWSQQQCKHPVKPL